MKQKIKPVFDRVLVKPIEQDEKKGNIIIADNAKGRPQRGTVVSVGDDVVVFKKGDTVFYGKHSGMELDHEEEEYIIMKQDEIYCKLKSK